ncbi:MAG TPA: hypothetical protein VFB32_12815 [Rudaea sp.]|nr:hypothetical protein [Rudaea sp.]
MMLSLDAADSIFTFFDALVACCATGLTDFAAVLDCAVAGLAAFAATAGLGAGLTCFGAACFFAGGALADFTGARAGTFLAEALGGAAFFAAGFGEAAFFFAGCFLPAVPGLRLLVAIWFTIVPRRSRVIA